MIYQVTLTNRARKQLEKLPSYIIDKLDLWMDMVEKRGLEIVRRIPSFHDEPLKGQRKGERSIRLNRAYRAIYIVKSGEIEFVEIQEVNKHDY